VISVLATSIGVVNNAANAPETADAAIVCDNTYGDKYLILVVICFILEFFDLVSTIVVSRLLAYFKLSYHITLLLTLINSSILL
jgi:hypothetical protein